MKRLLISLSVIGLLIVGIVLYLWLLPPADTGKMEADLQLPAAELYQSYQEDEIAGNRQYIDKIILVEGRVAEKLQDEQGAPVLLLREGAAPFGGVMCTLDKREAEKAANLKTGDLVRVKGQCTGMLMEVVLNKCVLVE